MEGDLCKRNSLAAKTEAIRTQSGKAESNEKFRFNKALKVLKQHRGQVFSAM